MRTWIVILAGILAGVIATTPLGAQESEPQPAAVASPVPGAAIPPPSAETPPPTAAEPNASQPAPAVPGPIAACLPSCRVGFTCVRGQCVSSCNPPCSIGDSCTAAGQCEGRPIKPLPGSPEAARQAPGYETHDGFFLRVTSGFGGGAITLDIPDVDEQTYSGVGWSTSVDIGGSPVHDLVIFGRLRGAWMIEPTLRVDGTKVEDTEGLAVNQGLVGAGLNYYVMPLNLYFGGVVGFAVIEAVQSKRNRADKSDSSEVGLGVDLDVGKEWWVDDNWGIGVAVRLSLSAVPAAEDLPRDAVFGSGFVAALFSATYQ